MEPLLEKNERSEWQKREKSDGMVSRHETEQHIINIQRELYCVAMCAEW